MNNKFEGLYNTEQNTFITDKVEPINYYEPAIKTPRIENHNYSINFDKKELYKEIETLKQELQRKDNIINELNKDLEYYKHEEELYRYYQQENPRLMNNWNELKEWLDKEINNIKFNYSQLNGNYFNMNYVIETYENVLDKIKELENDK